MCLNNKLVPIGLLTLFVRRLCLQPLQVWQGRRPFSAIDHHWKEAKFATAGSQLDVWDHDRSEPIHSFNWGVESLLTCKWNPAEAGLLASTATDRNLALYDIREASPVRKLIMAVRHGRCALRRCTFSDDDVFTQPSCASSTKRMRWTGTRGSLSTFQLCVQWVDVNQRYVLLTHGGCTGK